MNQYLKNFIIGGKAFMTNILTMVVVGMILIVVNMLPFPIFAKVLGVMIGIVVGLPLFGWLANTMWKWK